MTGAIIKTLMKWGPILIAAVMAASETWSEQKEAERIDNIEERLNKLENNEEETEEES